MNKDLQEKIFQAFPELYKERYLPATQTCMCWGLSTGDGWFKILWEMSEKLDALNVDKNIVIKQVKEKFGTLRVSAYISNFRNKRISSDLNARERRKIKRSRKALIWNINNIIDIAEKLSYQTCEFCGESGSYSIRGNYVSITCETCKIKYGYVECKDWDELEEEENQ